jgi:phospholipase D1/2
VTRKLGRLGLDAIFKSLEETEKTDPLIAPPITVSSSHTKHALEDLHPNIAVFRHPDHLPDGQVLAQDFVNQFKSLTLNAASASKLPSDALKSIYGAHGDTVLYWAHHEKLCLVDGETAFMGGLDLCYGRWDTNQHSIADAHPGNLDEIVFPGQDFNNARVMDFQDVVNWQNNKLDRKTGSRMGWSDVSISIHGPVVNDLREHFVQRWNFIFYDKYNAKNEGNRYAALEHIHTGHVPAGGPSGVPSGQYDGASASQPTQAPGQGNYFPPPPTQAARGVEDEEEGDRGFFSGRHGEGQGSQGGQGGHGGHGGGRGGRFQDKLKHKAAEGAKRVGQKYGVDYDKLREGFMGPQVDPAVGPPRGPIDAQICRSCAEWSHNCSVEHSIANAYIEVIRNSQHFVYIENQFFITATGDKQRPIKNMIGAAIVERIVRAARNGENYKMFVMIPAIPGFAGDLKADDALGTRAIMEFQYNSISRGGHSIMESIAQQGINPVEYIRFYNLRNYDRINSSGVMRDVEHQSGVAYEDARREHDERYGGNPIPQEYGEGQTQQAFELPADPTSPPPYQAGGAYQTYQDAAKKTGHRSGLGSGRWDSVAECYMLDGEDIREVPWEGGDVDEIDAFVNEELYLHSKLLIADDRVVICGSANLNDRSQLGNHDSEIALVMEDQTLLDSYMNGQRYQATRFAATLRRQIFRKHLGLLPPQDYTRPDANFLPVGQSPNAYDYGSEADQAVIDPLSPEFQRLWNSTARNNTDAFERVFHCVPTDKVRTWKQYDDWFEQYFGASEESKKKIEENGGGLPEGRYKWGHVVREDFPGGVKEVKEVLSGIRGTLVEMPLLFLKDEDIAKEGLGLNAFTEEVYT